MSRYIDSIWLYENFKEQAPQFAEKLKDLILVAPSVDIVRCGECKHWIDDRKGEDDMGTCGLTHYFTNANDFCSYGEPKEK